MRGNSRMGVALLFVVFTASAIAAGSNEADETPLTARQQATVDRLAAVFEGYSSSADLALRALYSTPELEQRPDGTIRAREDVTLAGLIDQARGSTDPVALNLLLRRCPMQDTKCDRVELATRWTRVDTQNQVAWLVLASAQRESGDVDGARATFVRASRASLWNDHYNDVIRRAARALPSTLPATDRAAAMVVIFAKSGVVVPFGALRTLGDYCKEPGAMREACARIVEVMVRDANEMMALNVAVPYAIHAHVAQSTIATYQQKADAMWWASLRMAPIWPLTFDPYEEANAPAILALVRELNMRVDLGEVRRSQQYLQEERVSEAEAAKRYVASLSEWQLKHRADLQAEQAKAATVD